MTERDPTAPVEPGPGAEWTSADEAAAAPGDESGTSAAPGGRPGRERAGGWLDGDAAVHLEDLVVGSIPIVARTGAAEGVPIELVGSHLRVSGTVNIGHHRRLSDFVNHHDGLMALQDATVLRRNGVPTRVTAPSIWVSPDEVTLIGQEVDDGTREVPPEFRIRKRPIGLIVVTPGHTLTGEVHLVVDAVLSMFIESNEPRWIAMTDVRTRSLADRRVVARYAFALLNRTQIVAATELQPGMVRGRTVL